VEAIRQEPEKLKTLSQKLVDFITSIFELIVYLIGRLVRFIVKLTGFSILVTSIFISFVLLVLFFGFENSSFNFSGSDSFYYFNPKELAELVISSDIINSTWFKISFYVFAFIPLLSLLLIALKLMGNKQVRLFKSFVILGIVWLIASVSLLIEGKKLSSDFSSYAWVESNYILNDIQSDTLVLQSSAELFNYESVFLRFGANRNLEFAYQNDVLHLANISLKILESTDSVASIKIKKISNGPDKLSAGKIAEKINYPFSIEGNTIRLSPSFSLGEKELWRNQEVEISLYIPNGNTLYFAENAQLLIEKIDSPMIIESGKYWKMKEGDLFLNY
jgi:hypothetical protein